MLREEIVNNVDGARSILSTLPQAVRIRLALIYLAFDLLFPPKKIQFRRFFRRALADKSH